MVKHTNSIKLNKNDDNFVNIFNFSVAVFDLDLTLWDGTKLYDDVINILQALKDAGIRLFIASFHLEAKKCCDLLGISFYFDEIYYGRTKSKADMIKDIKERHNIYTYEIAFFDDNFNNILDVKKQHNIKTIHISKDGLSWYHLPIRVKLNDMYKKRYNIKYHIDKLDKTEVFDYYLE